VCARDYEQKTLADSAGHADMTEAGYPEIEGDTWVGVLVPARTSKDIINFLNREVVKTIAMPDMEARLAELGYDPVASTPEEFAVRIKAGGPYQGGIGRPIRTRNDISYSPVARIPLGPDRFGRIIGRLTLMGVAIRRYHAITTQSTA
jgi:hypothetical protein